MGSWRIGAVSLACLLLLAGAAVVTCGGSSSTCVAGQSSACVGVGGCSGFQTCKSDGTYDVCNCGPAPDGGLIPEGGADTSTADSAGADTSTTGDGGAWSPSKLSGLVLWLDDTVGVVIDSSKPGYLRRWLDQSGKGNDADTLNYTSAELAVDPSVVGGHDAYINTDVSFLGVADTADFHWGTGDFMIAMVVRLGSNPQNFHLWNKPGNGTNLDLYADTSGNIEEWVDNTTKVVAGNPDTSKFHVVVALGAAMQLRVDGIASNGPTNTTDISVAGYEVAIFQSGSAGSNEVAEVVAVKGTVPTADVLSLEAYLKAKFKL